MKQDEAEEVKVNYCFCESVVAFDDFLFLIVSSFCCCEFNTELICNNVMIDEVTR